MMLSWLTHSVRHKGEKRKVPGSFERKHELALVP